MRQHHEALEARGVQVVVVGPEPDAAFASYWRANALPFVGLPDPRHQVLKLYGQEVKLFKFGRMPAQLLVDAAGTVRFVSYGHSMSDIPDPREVLELVEKIDPKKLVERGAR